MQYEFIVEPSLFEEQLRGLSPHDTALSFARGKAEEVFSRFPEAVVLGADTVVTIGGELLGKPKDDGDARRMLKMLSGRTHTVYTGVCVLARGYRAETVEGTEVTFEVLSDALIDRYVESGLVRDKAGAYGIQDGYPLVKEIQGSYTNVIGLPTEKVGTMLEGAMGGKRC